MPSEDVTSYFVVVEAIVVVVTLLFGFYTYVRQEALQTARDDLGRACCDKKLMGYFVAKQPATLAYFFRLRTTIIPEVPTIASLIRAGDDLMYTSSMFDQIPPSVSQQVCWVSLYTQFFNEMAWLKKSRTSRAGNENKYVERYLSQADKYVLQKGFGHQISTNDLEKLETRGQNPSRSITTILAKLLRKAPKSDSDSPSDLERHFLYLPKQKGNKKSVRMVYCVRDISDKSLSPPSIRFLTSMTISRLENMAESAYRYFQGAQNNQITTRPLWLVDNKPCIETSREELAGLALIMGVNLVKSSDDSVSGTGPFGIHLNAAKSKDNVMNWQLHLTHQYRQPDHEASKGSGYSTLFAKHMACDSLPFKCVVVDDDGLIYSGEGGYIHRCTEHMGTDRTTKWSEGCINSIYVDQSLLQIIKDRKVNKPWEQSNLESTSTQKYLSRLPTAVQVVHTYRPAEGDQNGDDKSRSNYWFMAVSGIAFGGLVPQAGENLVAAVLFTVTSRGDFDYRDCPYHNNIIEALQELVDALHDDDPKLNLFGNYVAKRPRKGMKEVDCSIPSTSRSAGALFGRYMTALERLAAMGGRQIGEIYRKCYDLLKKDYDNGHKDNLAEDVKSVTKVILSHDHTKITVDACGKVARCIIAAWAYRVPRITLNWETSKSPAKPLTEPPALQDLPVVSAFGL